LGRINDSELAKVEEIKSLVKENNGEYTLEPGVAYDDLQYFVVPKDRLYVVDAQLDWPYEGNNPEDGYNVDASAVVLVPK
jgi:hypothetical protein